MTDKNLVEVVVLLDRSGSMGRIREDMNGGFQTFVDEQKALPGKCVFTLYEFNTSVQKRYEEINVNDVGSLNLVPMGGTALYDAIGTAVTEVGNRLASKKESKRPGGVIFLIITDGEENSSHEYRDPKIIKDLINHQESKYGWKFAYLSADQNAILAGTQLGIRMTAQYGANAVGTKGLYDAVSHTLDTYRGNVARGKATQDLSIDPDLGGN